MAPEVFTFTSAKRGRVHGHDVVEYRVQEGDSGVVHCVAPLLVERLETTKVPNPHEGGERYRVVVHYSEPQGINGKEIDFHVDDLSILGLISDIREEHGMSRL
jgi:hypothetical protein